MTAEQRLRDDLVAGSPSRYHMVPKFIELLAMSVLIRSMSSFLIPCLRMSENIFFKCFSGKKRGKGGKGRGG